MSEDYYKLTKEPIEKFQYAFAGLCFVALSFSIQFSNQADNKYLLILLTSWLGFLSAGILTGQWLINSSTIDRLNYQINHGNPKNPDEGSEWINNRSALSGKLFKWQIRSFLIAITLHGIYMCLNLNAKNHSWLN